MIYWGNHYDRFFNVFIKYGAVVNITHLHRLSIGNASTSNGKRKTHGARVVQKPRSEPELVQVDLFVLDVQEVETARH